MAKSDYLNAICVDAMRTYKVSRFMFAMNSFSLRIFSLFLWIFLHRKNLDENAIDRNDITPGK